MKKTILCCVVACVSVLTSPAFPNGNPAGGVTVSPQTFLLSMEQSGRVTVHTNIAFLGETDVVLKASDSGGVPALCTFADDRGDLVAKFDESEVKAMVAPPEATLELVVEGESVGSDTVRVIE